MAYDVDGAKGIGDIPQERAVNRKEGNYTFKEFDLNCTDGAFENAIATLAARAKTWGAQRAELKEWIRGQDAVFSNCGAPAAKPNAAKPEWPALLRQDRAYQIAAADFYAGNFDDAVKGFEAVGRDKASPWSRWGEYLAARSEVRKASATVDPTRETAAFDTDSLKAAQTRLLRVEQQTKDPAIRHATADELGFIQVRLDPGARLDAVSVALAGPTPDPDFRNHVADLDFLLDRGDVKSSNDLGRWIQVWQNGGGADSAQISSLPWLVATLAAATKDDAQLPELMAAAAKVSPESPAYATVTFHRARLLLATNRQTEARALLTTVLAATGKEDSAARNALLEERMPTARTLPEFLADAPRTMIESGSEAAGLAVCGNWGSARSGCLKKLPEMQFDGDAATAFNQQLPLAIWARAAQGTALPENLRQAVAWAAWLRALGLGDRATVRRMSTLLPEPARRTAGESDGFPATLALLRNPGLRPFLQQGVQRSVTFGAMEEFRDNWWCSKWGDGQQFNSGNMPDVTIAPPPGPLPFLTPEERKSAETERARLNQLPLGVVWVGQRAIDYVKVHPQDKDAAEALALTVRATHYGCDSWQANPERTAVSKQAFELLHKRYPKSEWAAKTKYYY